MKRQFIGALATWLVGSGISAAAQTPEERDAARRLLEERGDAVVTVIGSGKIRISRGGVETLNRDERIQSVATVLDPTGLAVMSLGALDPGELLAGTLAQNNAPGAPAVDVSTDATDLRYRLADGREVPARVVLRDKDLDLAFLRPAEEPTEPMSHVEGAAGEAAAADLLVILQRLPEVADWKAGVLFTYVLTVIDAPRTVYPVNSTAFGSPAFDTRGRFVGVVVRRRTGIGQASAAPPVVLPASDIREVAKQAE